LCSNVDTSVINDDVESQLRRSDDANAEATVATMAALGECGGSNRAFAP